MRIPLTGKDVIITDQLQTYVEYRLFTSIARYQALIREVNVTLEHNRGNRGRFLCVVTVDLGPASRSRFALRRPPECRNRSGRGSDVVTAQPPHLSGRFILNPIFHFEIPRPGRTTRQSPFPRTSGCGSPIALARPLRTTTA